MKKNIFVGISSIALLGIASFVQADQTSFIEQLELLLGINDQGIEIQAPVSVQSLEIGTNHIRSMANGALCIGYCTENPNNLVENIINQEWKESIYDAYEAIFEYYENNNSYPESFVHLVDDPDNQDNIELFIEEISDYTDAQRLLAVPEGFIYLKYFNSLTDESLEYCPFQQEGSYVLSFKIENNEDFGFDEHRYLEQGQERFYCLSVSLNE